jgi:hypothetical protein
MLLERIMQRPDAQKFLDDLLDNQIPRNRDKGTDPIYVRSYVVQHHWRKRWVTRKARNNGQERRQATK